MMKIKNYLLLISAGLIILVFEASAVGVYTEIPSNPTNALNKQLQEKEAELLKKEAEINNRQAPFQNKIFIGGGIILTLVLLNFYLDYRHRKNSGNET